MLACTSVLVQTRMEPCSARHNFGSYMYVSVSFCGILLQTMAWSQCQLLALLTNKNTLISHNDEFPVTNISQKKLFNESFIKIVIYTEHYNLN